ncbi:alpha/beta hydrolase-fold protein [Bosea sp. 117]|uniref:alpha/beta hydrolase n=1 Tax=Bosea sp. 117 TaxID=1125973 RepID=UPI00049405F0|nr:alpha/beta hydrolase-fold protein [Bosea sp. 117]
MPSEVTLPGTRVFDLAPPGGGEPWRIFLAVPEAPAPAGGFPSIFMLDANAGFATLVETLRRGAMRPAATGIVPAVLVGIGYPTETLYERARRTYDYSPGPSSEARVPGADDQPPTGGRDRLLAFIEQELKPTIAGIAPLDPARQTLLGHSLAGFFALDVLTRNTSAFRSYIAVSPSIWWDEARLNAGLAAIAPPAAPVRLVIAVGEWEQALAPWQQGRPDSAELAARRSRRAMVDRARLFAERAAIVLGTEARVRFDMLPEEDHASVLPAAMSRAIRFVLREDEDQP